MEFVACGEKHSRRQDERDPSPRRFDPASQTATKQQREDRVFGKMGRLADKEMRLRDGGGRNVGVQPTQQRGQNAGGMLGRHQISGSKKHERHPEDNRQPSLNNFAKIQGRSLVGRRCLTNSPPETNLAAESDASADLTACF